MADESMLQARMVESVYSLMKADRLSWKGLSRDSYQAIMGDVKVDLDKGAVGENVTYIMYIWGKDSNLAGRIDGRGINSTPNFSDEKDYQSLLKKMYSMAQQHVRATALEEALIEVEAFRGNNSSS